MQAGTGRITRHTINTTLDVIEEFTTMICLIAGDAHEAETFAKSQFLARDDWFYPEDENDLRRRTNFHVLVVGSAGHNIPVSYFNKIYALAQTRGRINRQ